MSALASISDPTRARATSKPRLGFLGVGWIGRNRMAAIAQAGCGEIVAIGDPFAEALEQSGPHAPAAAQVCTLQEIMDVGLDGLVIATPSAQHAAQSIAALESGLAVFCQKPLGRNAAETEEVVACAREAGRLLGVDLSYRHTAAMQAVRAAVRGGELGEVFAVDLVFHNAYGPQAQWFYDPAQSGGGCVLDLGIHLVDAALWVLDRPVEGVSSRLYQGGRRLRRRENVAEDYAVARLDLAGGATIGLRCSWRLHAGADAIIEATFRGTRGSVSMRNLSGSFFDFTAEHLAGTARETLCEPPDDWGGRAAVHWARQLAGGSGYDPEVERLVEVARVLDAIYDHCDDE